MPIKVWNSKDHAVYLRSFDGDSVHVGPKARGVSVPNKFKWQIPDGVKVEDDSEEDFDPTAIVKGRTPFAARRPVRAHTKENATPPVTSAAAARAEADRRRQARERAAAFAAQAKAAPQS